MFLLLVTLVSARPVDPASPAARLTSTLAEAWRVSADPGALARFQANHPRFTDTAQVVVTLRPGADGAALAARLRLDVEAEAEGALQVRVPLGQLGELAAAPEVAHVREPWRVSPKATEKLTEGYAATMVQDWHTTAGYTGKGVSVGIVDVGFDGYEGLQGGELPDEVEADLDRGAPASSDHGTAVAEVLHDFVPDAALHLVSFGTDVEFAEALQTLLDAQVDVVNASVGFDNTWSLDGTSTLSRAADAMTEAGIVYVGAAGNEDERYRVGELTPESGTEYIQVGGHYGIQGNAPKGRVKVSFRWNEPFGAAKTDLDLLVVDAETEAECGRSENPQDGDDDPYESVDVDGCGESIFAIVYANPGTDVTGLTGWLYNAHGLDADELTHVSTLSLPADCLTCLAVGAYTIDDQTLASYSSRGPTEDGRTKPDVVGPTDVTTTTLGDEAFSGSSAAAPHVAGLAALWVDATEVHDDPAGFAAWQQDEARDAGDAGMDNTYGWGLATGDEAPGCGCSGVDGPGAGGLAAVAVAGFLVRRRGR